MLLPHTLTMTLGRSRSAACCRCSVGPVTRVAPRRPLHRPAGNHYQRLKVPVGASAAEIKKSFYALSKCHHPDANPSDPNAGFHFGLLSESYAVLSDPARRAAYDRDLLGVSPPRSASYSSTASTVGSRPASGLSRRRTHFRPSSFRRTPSSSRPGAGADGGGFGMGGGGGMGPGSSPFKDADEVPPHFDKASHSRTHEQQDLRRRKRSRRALNDDGTEFEPQASPTVHFIIIVAILGTSFLVPFFYLRLVPLQRSKKDREHRTQP